MKDIIP